MITDNRNISQTGERKFLDIVSDFFGRIANKPTASQALSAPGLSETSARIGYILKGFGLAVLSVLLGNAPPVMGANPLGTALLCAAGKYAGFIYSGLIVSSLFRSGAITRIAIYSFAIALRIIISVTGTGKNKKIARKRGLLDFILSPPPYILHETLSLRVCAGIATAMVSGIWRILAGGLLIYDLIGTMFELAVTPAAVFLFAGAFRSTAAKSRVEAALATISDAPYRELGMLAILAALSFSIKEVTFYGFSAASILITFSIFFIAKKGGMLRACVCGLICGLVYRPELAPAFGLAGLSAGLLQGIGVLAMCAASCAVGGAYGIYATGFEALRTLVPDLIGASGIYIAALKLGFLPRVTIFTSTAAPPDERAREATVAERRQKSDEQRLSAMSEAMKSLSEVFYTLSDRLRRPGIYDARRLCDEIMTRRCVKCRNCVRCTENNTPEKATELLSHAVIEGNISNIPEDLIAELSHECFQIKNILIELDEAHSKLLEDSARFNNAEIFALDYSAASKLLSEAAAYNREEYTVDEARSEKLRRAARYLDFSTNNIAVYGTRKRCVIAGGVDLSRVKLSAAKLSEIFGKACGSVFAPPKFELDGDYATMTLTARRTFSAVSYSAGCAMRDGEPNGDTQTSFENTEDYYYAIISDGMGSGRDAALTSRLCCVFLERMLMAGNRKNITLEMLNNFIRCKNIECHATVDMIEIDLLDGSASFIKSGAATSYLLRDGRLFAVSAAAMPVGLTREINAEEIKFNVETGDIIVMVSDGVAQNEESIWLTELLAAEQEAANEKGFDPDALARLIVDEAKFRRESKDDITALVTEIKRI